MYMFTGRFPGLVPFAIPPDGGGASGAPLRRRGTHSAPAGMTAGFSLLAGA